MAADEDLAVLKGAWAGVCAASGVALFDLAFRLIEFAYSRPERHYHNLRHIADCLREFADVRPACQDAAAVEAALLFHDYEYAPTRQDNEERSADEAAKRFGP